MCKILIGSGMVLSVPHTRPGHYVTETSVFYTNVTIFQHIRLLCYPCVALFPGTRRLRHRAVPLWRHSSQHRRPWECQVNQQNRVCWRSSVPQHYVLCQSGYTGSIRAFHSRLYDQNKICFTNIIRHSLLRMVLPASCKPVVLLATGRHLGG